MRCQFFHQDTSGIVANSLQENVILHNLVDRRHLIQLMKILNGMNASGYAFEEILCWAVTARREAFPSTADQGYSRNSNLRWIFGMTATELPRLPSVYPVVQGTNAVNEYQSYSGCSTAQGQLKQILVPAQRVVIAGQTLLWPRAHGRSRFFQQQSNPVTIDD